MVYVTLSRSLMFSFISLLSLLEVWEHFCGKQLGKGAKFATCSAKAQQNNVKGNPHLVAYYRKVWVHT